MNQEQDPPMTITRKELLARIHDARWLSQCVHYTPATSDLIKMIAVGDQSVEFANPSPGPRRMGRDPIRTKCNSLIDNWFRARDADMC